MKILFISGELIGSSVCQKLLKEGNEVKLYIDKQDWKQCLDGIVPKVEDWRKELDWVGKDGLIVFDDVIFGKEQDDLRNLGYQVFGSSKESDRLELDRGYFHKICEKYGIKTLQSHDFLTADKAINFIKKNPSRWVIKQSSHLSSLNYIGELESGEDSIQVLKEYKKKKISPIHIQQYVNGIEVGVGRYFNGNDWVGPIEINHEHKRLNNGDTGPLTPEMGTILKYTNQEVKLYKEIIKKFEPHLREVGFKGDFEINCIVDEDGVWPLEATPRFGTPAVEIHVALNNTPWSDFLSAVATNKPCELDYSNEYGICVSVAAPPFPYEQTIFDIARRFFTSDRLTFSKNMTEDELNNIHFEEISKDNRGYFWSGTQGWMFHVTAKSHDIKIAQQKVYDTIKKIHMPNMIYRTDIGTRVVNHDLPKLKKWGWI